MAARLAKERGRDVPLRLGVVWISPEAAAPGSEPTLDTAALGGNVTLVPVELIDDAALLLDTLLTLDAIVFAATLSTNPASYLVGEAAGSAPAACGDLETTMSLIKGIGMPNRLFYIATEGSKAVRPKVLGKAKGALATWAAAHFGGAPKVLVSPAPAVFLARLRGMHLVAPRRLKGRSLLLTTEVTLLPEVRTLALRAIVRGARLSASDTLHLPGIGDYHIDRILDPAGQAGAQGPTGGSHASAFGGQVLPVLDEPGEDQVPLEADNLPDPLAGEQTWPTADELDEAYHEEDDVGGKLVPAGTAAYQAEWLPDAREDDAHEVYGGIEVGDEAPPMALVRREVDEEEEEEEKERAGDDDDDDEYEYEYSDDEDMTGHDVFASRRGRSEEEKEVMLEQRWPDEVVVQKSETAREKFMGHRGLASFRNSRWDHRLNVPPEYGRIFRFTSLAAERRDALAAEADKAIAVGQYVEVHLRLREDLSPGIGAELDGRVAWALRDGLPLRAVSLFPHERKTSVLHFAMLKHPSYGGIIRSTDEVVIQCGPRRWFGRPLYSENNPGGDKHRMERFLHDERPSMASVYGPTTYPPAPVLFLHPETGALMATGTLASVNPDRVILRRSVLTGVPVRIGKSAATVRGMFHNARDVRFFKSIPLWTKYGRSGNIVEPIGTHGRMKCVFDKQLLHADTICLSLFDRVYPVPLWDEDGRRLDGTKVGTLQCEQGEGDAGYDSDDFRDFSESDGDDDQVVMMS